MNVPGPCSESNWSPFLGVPIRRVVVYWGLVWVGTQMADADPTKAMGCHLAKPWAAVGCTLPSQAEPQSQAREPGAAIVRTPSTGLVCPLGLLSALWSLLDGI